MMSGRYTLRASPSDLTRLFGAAECPPLNPRFNVAPSQPVPIVRVVRRGETGAREIALMRWGLVPAWLPEFGAGFINARAESVAEKPSFREAFRHRRCLIPADGFYEWHQSAGRGKQPYHFALKDGRPFAFTGLWDRWGRGPEQAQDSCAIITCQANGVVGPVHARMPVILAPEHWDRWLDPTTPIEELQAMLCPHPDDDMVLWEVSRHVNRPANEDPACLVKLQTPAPPAGG